MDATQAILDEVKAKHGFCSPCLGIGKGLGEDFQNVIANYHRLIWEKEGVLPLKYKCLIALATAVTGKEPQRAVLETAKALRFGATEDEIKETLQLCVWLAGAPVILEVAQKVLQTMRTRVRTESNQ